MVSVTSLFVHEQNSIDEIRRHFSDKKAYRVLSNLLIYDPQSNHYYEYDLVIVSRTNIFVVELKHWSGHIEIASYDWRINERTYRRDPHALNIYKCKVLKGLYEREFPTYPNLWVESVVVLTHPDATVEGADSPKGAADEGKVNPTFASVSDFISYVNRRSSKHESRVLADYQIDAIADHLHALSKPKDSVPDVILGYEIVETLTATSERLELLGRHADGHIKGLKRLRIFRAPAGYEGDEKKRFLRQAYNALKSVWTIGDHPNVLQVQVVEDNVHGVVELSDWSDTGTLRDYLDMTTENPDRQTAFSICQGILSALIRAHECNIIHRGVKPQNILLIDNRPKLMNFDLAYIVEEDRVTVIEDPTSISDDGYMAPEILFGEDIDETTDYFGLGIIAYKLLTGERPFRTVSEYIAKGGRLSAEPRRKLEEVGLSKTQVSVISGMLIADRSARIKDLDAILEAFELAEERRNTVVQPEVEVFAPGSTHDTYEIIELIGEGREAHVYKGKTKVYMGKEPEDRIVALKIFKPDIPRERWQQELMITSWLNSSYVIRTEDYGRWRNQRYFLAIGYIEGQSMRSLIKSGQRPSLEDFRTIALGLMEALGAFHNFVDEEGTRSPLLHCDIKPDNIMITHDNKPVLIDCTLAGEPRIGTFQGTRPYVPPDSVSGSDVQFSQSSDLYALGVTLWEWLFGCLPYRWAAVGDEPELPDGFTELPEYLRTWLRKAVATNSEERFKSVAEMRAAFTEDSDRREQSQLGDRPSHATFAPSESPEQGEYVAYLNTLSNNSALNENATAEHQVLSGQFQRIHVKNPVTDTIYEKLISERRNVVLTGNAGDGKTTIALEIFRRVSGEQRALKPIETIPGVGLVIVKDMSELPREQQVVLVSDAKDRRDFVYLIVTNTGTFLESLKRVFQGEKDESTLLNALKADAPQSLFDDRFYVVNLGRIDSIKTACRVLRKMVAEENWLGCVDCENPMNCPLYVNVNLIREREGIFFERLELLYRRLFEYGTRLTMRHMTGHLAYALTGGFHCDGIRRRSVIGADYSLTKELFFNRFFGDDGSCELTRAKQLYAIRKIREMGLGTILDSQFERLTWLKEPRVHREADSAHERVWNLITQNKGAVNRRQMRRYAFFFDPFENARQRERFISTFLRSELLLEYVEYCSKNDSLPARAEHSLRKQIMQVLQEFFTGLRFPEGGYDEHSVFVTLNRGSYASGTQMVLADFKVDDFGLVVKPRYEIGEVFGGVLALKYLRGKRDRDIELVLDLPFLDYVARRYKGEVAEELSAFYADRLERLKVELLTEFERENVLKPRNELQLLIVGRGRRIELKRLLLEDGRVEVL
jgi:serine/threonine protein kinase